MTTRTKDIDFQRRAIDNKWPPGLSFTLLSYNASHDAIRDEVRAWVEEKIEPHLNDWEKQKFVPVEIYKEMDTRGYLPGLLGVKYPKEYTPYSVPFVPPEKWDHFHEFLLTDELSCTGSGGFVWNMIGG
ncbi:hypothetical protein B9Z19DRAFT_1066992 [Tuber borchii]|uniref:Acyl-CoA dehydrogenase/oxidase N-terminal domain-containing protein n=1 Tax=Tuber borchii TaxID=42251 RepID=A0A2T6ZKB6_TUBBO|nr:hypothetical protein B9Z19DRAFT_1066992 [Tuber borchii]